jgi:hypothetical protein
MSRIKTLLQAIAFIVLSCAAMYYAGRAGMARVDEASALRCARSSSGTDQSIADCFTVRGLRVPEDL